MRSVADCFAGHNGRLIDKWEHYLPIYEHHFAKYVGKPVSVLEIGVSHGGSLQMWKEYFGPQASIVGIDIDPRCVAYEEDQIMIYTANQADSDFMTAFNGFDIVIDDGSHVISDQEASFKALWPSTRGVYLIEDCHQGYPEVNTSQALVRRYPWVMVLERPKRRIRGTPSRELRQDEVDAINLYSDV